jgi:hypothetical protein
MIASHDDRKGKQLRQSLLTIGERAQRRQRNPLKRPGFEFFTIVRRSTDSLKAPLRPEGVDPTIARDKQPIVAGEDADELV